MENLNARTCFYFTIGLLIFSIAASLVGCSKNNSGLAGNRTIGQPPAAEQPASGGDQPPGGGQQPPGGGPPPSMGSQQPRPDNPKPNPLPVSPIPEPASIVLLGSGLLGLSLGLRKRFFKK